MLPISSNINEGIRGILNLFIVFFFTRRFYTHKKHKKNKNHKKHKKHNKNNIMEVKMERDLFRNILFLTLQLKIDMGEMLKLPLMSDSMSDSRRWMNAKDY